MGSKCDLNFANFDYVLRLVMLNLTSSLHTIRNISKIQQHLGSVSRDCSNFIKMHCMLRDKCILRCSRKATFVCLFVFWKSNVIIGYLCIEVLGHTEYNRVLGNLSCLLI